MGTVLDFCNEYNNSDWVSHDMPNEITKRYEIKACLMMQEDKQVYLVTSKINWKKYLLKVLAKNCHENLAEEYKLSTELSHPGIVAGTEYIEGKDYNYLIRDYVEGYTVTELVEMTEEGHLPKEELLRIMLQLCDILQYLHSQKPPIIHRDIKPDNIIITKQRECKLIDFGISRRYQGKGVSDTFVMGSPYSAPPEQYGFAQTDERSDIYSLGILMFYMATGSMNMKERKQYQIPGDIRRIIKKCTRFNPRDRYTSVKLLKHKLISYPYLYNKRWLLYAGLPMVVIALVIGLAIPVIEGPLSTLLVANKREMIREATETQSDVILQEEAVIIQPEITFHSLEETDVPNETEESSDPSGGEADTELAANKEETVGNNISREETVKNITIGENTSSYDSDRNEGDFAIGETAGVETSDYENKSGIESGATETSTDSVDVEAEQPQNLEKGNQGTKPLGSDNKDQGVYTFTSPLIEAAVRQQLGRDKMEAVTYRDMQQITSLLICGQQSYSGWEEHFVYGINQYMIGAQYTKLQLFKRNGEITSLDDISYMVNLEKLALYNQRISDLTPLKELHYLSYLGLGSNEISELAPITELKSLNYLDISGNPIQNNEIDQLKELPYLWGLDLGATKVTNIYGIKDIKLSFLSLFECKVGDCIGLEEMTTLENLVLTGVNNSITHQAIDRIAKLTNLKILKIFGSDSIDLSKLSSLEDLYLLDLCGMWNKSDLKALRNPALSQLYIDACQKLDLTGIEYLPYVEQISLRDSVCTDYSPLLGVTTLKRLYCSQEQRSTILEQLGRVPFEIIAQ